MRDFLPYVVIGLTTGGIYALAALGLVLTYRTSGVFNFAHGAIGMFATYMFYSFRQHIPTAPAALLAVLVVAPLLGIVIDRLLLRRLEGAPAASYIVASLGLLVALQGIAVAIYGGETRRIDAIFPRTTFKVFGVFVGYDQALVVAIALTAALGLIAFFRFTHLGLATRAVVSNRSLTGLSGTNPGAITTFSWMLGSAFAALSGILFAPAIGLDSLLLTLLVVEAFGAAALGRLRSFPITVTAAFGLGVIQAVATKIVNESTFRSLVGLPSAVPFVALLAALVFSRRGSLTEITAPLKVRSGRGGRFRLPTARLAAAFGLAALLPPFLNGSRLVTLTATLGMILVFISLSLLVGLSRQVSLAHAIFVAFGATTLSHVLDAGVPYLVALPLSALILVPFGAAMAIPAIRLSGLYLALATFAFGILAQNLLFPTGLAFGIGGVVNIPRPEFLTGDMAFAYFTLAVVLLGVVVVEVVRTTRLGRILIALADSPNAVESLGASPLAARVLAFCVSSFLAALAGGLLGSLIQSVNIQSYTAFHSLIWVTVLVAAGSRTFGGSVLAALAIVTLPSVVEARWAVDWQPIYFGIGAILLAQADNGLVGLLRLPDLTGLTKATAWRQGSRRSIERYRRRVSGEPVEVTL